MKIIVPMAGSGQRFVDAGYVRPKPLIRIEDVNSKRMIIEHVLEMFQDPNDQFVFICNHAHLQDTDMRDAIKKLKPDSVIIGMPPHKYGPVWTCMPAYPHIKDDEEVVVSYCDGAFKWNRSEFEDYVDNCALDGCLFTHSGFHPHTLSSTKMAFLKKGADGLVSAVKEKESYTDNPLSEHASSGVYYFRSGKVLKHYFDRTVKEKIGYRGEFYITLVYNLLIQDGLRVGYFDTPGVAILGTPEEVKNFEAWSTILRGSQVRNPEDLLRCYAYWKTYHEL